MRNPTTRIAKVKNNVVSCPISGLLWGMPWVLKWGLVLLELKQCHIDSIASVRVWDFRAFIEEVVYLTIGRSPVPQVDNVGTVLPTVIRNDDSSTRDAKLRHYDSCMHSRMILPTMGPRTNEKHTQKKASAEICCSLITG